MANINFDTDITDEMFEVVVQASLYREDPVLALKKLVPKTWSMVETKKALRYIQDQKDKLEDIKKSFIELESATLIDDNQDTIMLVYNKLLQKAQTEGKYEVVARILKEIRQLKAIENEQMKFEIIIKVDKPEEKK